MIREVADGDLFKSNAEALVNPVNTEGVMGAGLAREFRRRYPVMYQEYAEICRRQMLTVGAMHFWLTGRDQPKFIVNFPTKRAWRDASELHWIEVGLAELRAQLNMRDVGSVAIPALGCGLGGLEWEQVKSRVQRAFTGECWLQVYLYPPQPPRPPARRRRAATKK